MGKTMPPDHQTAPGFRPIDHVVVLMLENRSFDTMLGQLYPGRDGFDGLTGSEANPGIARMARSRSRPGRIPASAVPPPPGPTPTRARDFMTWRSSSSAPPG